MPVRDAMRQSVLPSLSGSRAPYELHCCLAVPKAFCPPLMRVRCGTPNGRRKRRRSERPRRKGKGRAAKMRPRRRRSEQRRRRHHRTRRHLGEGCGGAAESVDSRAGSPEMVCRVPIAMHVNALASMVIDALIAYASDRARSCAYPKKPRQQQPQQDSSLETQSCIYAPLPQPLSNRC